MDIRWNSKQFINELSSSVLRIFKTRPSCALHVGPLAWMAKLPRLTNVARGEGGVNQLLVLLHSNYNGDVAQKFDLLMVFDWGVPLTSGQCAWTAFCMFFSGIPHSTIFGWPKYARQILYLAYLGYIWHWIFGIWLLNSYYQNIPEYMWVSGSLMRVRQPLNIRTDNSTYRQCPFMVGPGSELTKIDGHLAELDWQFWN